MLFNIVVGNNGTLLSSGEKDYRAIGPLKLYGPKCFFLHTGLSILQTLSSFFRYVGSAVFIHLMVPRSMRQQPTTRTGLPLAFSSGLLVNFERERGKMAILVFFQGKIIVCVWYAFSQRKTMASRKIKDLV